VGSNFGDGEAARAKLRQQGFTLTPKVSMFTIPLGSFQTLAESSHSLNDPLAVTPDTYLTFQHSSNTQSFKGRANFRSESCLCKTLQWASIGYNRTLAHETNVMGVCHHYSPTG
jgi:hypothetical protein